MRERPDYVLIVGTGRSGSNWLMKLLDLSRETHCRNEPDQIAGSPFSRLPSSWIRRQREPELAAEWDSAIKWTVSQMGERDNPDIPPKDFATSVSRHLGLMRFVKRPKARRILSFLVPSLRYGEWPIPSLLVNRHVFQRALPVVKMHAAGWGAWVLENRRSVLVAHLVRHAGGYLNSWRTRYLSCRHLEEVAQANRERLRMVVDTDSSWRELLPEIESMSVQESELWYWRYANEIIYQAGMRSDRYQLVIYEDLAEDPVAVMRRLYEASGLAWDETIEESILATSSSSMSIANGWHEALSSDDLALVRRIMQDSVMRDWWSDQKADQPRWSRAPLTPQ